jgi:hypothetical protein
LRLPVPLLTLFGVQAAGVGHMLRLARASCPRARRVRRGQRRAARGSRVWVLTGCRGEGVGLWTVSALWVAYGGDPGGYRYLRLVARTLVCGALRPAVVLPGAVSRHAHAHREGFVGITPLARFLIFVPSRGAPRDDYRSVWV